MFKDARDYQILCLSLFLLLGVAMRDWSLRPEMVGVAVVAAIATQLALSLLIARMGQMVAGWTGYPSQWTWPAFNWRSPLISALGLSLLLRTDHMWTMALAAMLAIASKFFFKAQDKHFFNPANFGIIAVLLLTHDAWISPGQWGEDMWYALIFLGAGGLVLKRVGRWDTTGMFLGVYALLEAVRNVYLGWTWDVWGHRMMSGSLLLFALFMVTDPRSIPNAKPARLWWASAIAFLTFILRNQFYLSSAVFWALFALSPLTIVFDRLWQAQRFEWRRVRIEKLLAGTAAFAIAFLAFSQPAHAFCGFYVAKADTDLYNQASQVAIARDGRHTVLTMANDYQGDVSDFAMVVPVPTIIQEEQVNVAEPEIITRLDDFSAPRLVEYFDQDPCQVMHAYLENAPLGAVRRDAALPPSPASSPALGVTIEERFSVGEYDILILSATESDGLETWLLQNDYQLPQGASDILAPYIRQDMKFFVAKVNLEEFDSSEAQQLRPLQITYDSSRFMLPIRLGMLNAENEQDLIVYLLSPDGRAELTNYRTVNIPTNEEIPLFVQSEFGEFYPDMFQRQYEAEDKEVAFLEYAWDTRNCDPCSAIPLTTEELKSAGAFWVDPTYQSPGNSRIALLPAPPVNNGAFITRLHVRYTRSKFPEDLMFQSTANRQLFQGRYVTRHPFSGSIDCGARWREENGDERPEPASSNNGGSWGIRQSSGRRPVFQPPSQPQGSLEDAIARGEQYNRNLAERFEREAQTLSRLTGANVQAIRQRISNEVPQPTPSRWLMMHPKR